MKRLTLTTLALTLCLTAGSLRAVEIGWVTIENQFQANLTAQVVDHAYTRVGNKFLAGLETADIEALEQSGISVEVLLRNADPEQVFRIISNEKRNPRTSNPQSLGTVTDLGGGMQLLESSLAAGQSLADDPSWLVTPLSELKARWYYAAPAMTTGLTDITNFPTDTLANLINQDSIMAFNQRLMDFRTRYIWTDSIDAARDWMMQKFLDWGYTDVSLQPFSYGGGTHYNLMVVKPGYAEPDKTIVVGGHYDSINGQSDPMLYAPGADDNGSGTTTTMEMARVLADVPLRKTIIFMPFSAEEVGLVGSRYAAQQFVANNTDIEVMYNYDMVGYDPTDAGEIAVSGPAFNLNYRDVSVAAASRVTSLTPVASLAPGSSDHQSFIDQGYPVVNNIEGTFNYPGWHTDADLTSNMNFEFMTEVIRMGMASLAIVANSASPTEVTQLIDQGDGNAIEVFWQNCYNDYSYKIFWGQTEGVYTDSADIPSGACSYVVSGLTEGTTYHFLVTGTVDDSYPSIYATGDSLTPLMEPRIPKQLATEPVLDGIQLDWAANPEADLVGYNIYRSFAGMDYALHQSSVPGTSFTDTDVMGQTLYNYRISAVDNDGYESDSSTESSMWAATFDGGILVVDEITEGSGVPTQGQQDAFWDTIFAETPIAIEPVEEAASALRRGIAGQYSSIFWFDDDLARKNILLSEDSLDWYSDYNGNMFVCGLRTIPFWTGSNITSDEMLYNEFGLAAYTMHAEADFIGAQGVAGWPDVQVDTDNFFNEIPYIPSLEPTPNATVILTYDALSDDPSREGEPVGLLRLTPNGYRVILSFPVIFLTDSSATELMSFVKQTFGESGIVADNGDVDDNGLVNVGDLTYMIDFLFRGGSLPPIPAQSDLNADCEINISDLSYLIDFLFRGGADPQPGCA